MIRIKLLIIAILLVVIVSCEKKAVQLPVLKISGIQDTIYDNTLIWLFFTTKNGDTIAELNRNNAISTTNWIFNIDKRLPLHQVVPHLKKLIEKREKPAMHPKDKDDTNYFSYVDSDSKTLSTVQFDVIDFITDQTIDKDKLHNSDTLKHLFIKYSNKGFFMNDSLEELGTFSEYLSKQPDSIQLILHLSFDKYVSYADYLFLKATLQHERKSSISISEKEYIQ